MPRWLAPNLITLMSLMHGIIGSTLLIYYCPTLTEAAPQWVYLFYAWCMFMYQTLDGIDGKQARRIGAASPLGQLFDHGCDALCCAFVGLSNCALLRLGSTWYSIAVYLIAIVPFFWFVSADN
jgi:phosphatidylglycerophosphate synthase